MHGRLRDLEKIDYGNPKAFRECPLRAQCTNDLRSVSRLERAQSEARDSRPSPRGRRALLRLDQQWMYQGAFLMRGLANVRAEFSLTALAYNLRRALNIVGVEAMTAAVAA